MRRKIYKIVNDVFVFDNINDFILYCDNHLIEPFFIEIDKTGNSWYHIETGISDNIQEFMVLPC